MTYPETLPNIPDGRTEMHVLPLPACCPFSQNPRPGSKVFIIYEPDYKVLEVKALVAYIYSYRGGRTDDQGKVVVRDMEQMISTIAQDCARAVGVNVVVYADLKLLPEQEMHIIVEGEA